MGLKTAAENIDALKKEASENLNSLFKIPDGFSSGVVERVVECIVLASALTVAVWQAEAVNQSTGKQNDKEE